MVQQENKISWDDYFFGILEKVSKRSSCDRGRNAALLVDEHNYILSSGFTGAPSGMSECDDIGHLYISKEGKQHCIRTIHAEVNAIAAAAKRGTPLNNSTLYCTMLPCWDCAKLIVQCGIKKICCENDYHAGERSKNLFEKLKITVYIKNMSNRKYE